MGGTQIDGDAYRGLFEANPHPMWVYERETLRFLAVNDSATRQYGYTREEFLQLTILDIRPEEEIEAVRSSFVRNLSAPRIWTHRRKDGSTLLAEITANDIVFMERDARLVLSLDVSLRERNAEMVRRSNRTQEAILHTAPVGILLVLPDGRLGDSNDEARRLLGSQGLDAVAGVIDTTLAGSPVEGFEIEMSSGVWAEVSARPIDFGKGATAAVIVLSDATGRRAQRSRLSREIEELETQIRERTTALNSSDAELQEFCFSVSHDLRGPLRAVDGFTQNVLSDTAAALTEENRESLQRVRQAAKRMGQLIDGLLVLSRVARAPLEHREIDLTALVTRSAADIQRANPNRLIRFEIAPNVKTYGDLALVTLLIDCLLGNAVKFTEPKEMATIEFIAEGGSWSIRDNGVGFDMAFESKLFKPFEKLHANTEFPGNGLGLAVAHRIVRRHGGTIEGLGEPGAGATFRFSLPGGEKA